MVSVTFIASDGAEQTINAEQDLSLMDSAVAAGIDAIEAICGGNAYCGTCRVYVDPAWREILGEASEIELPMIEANADETPGVRLSCQIIMSSQYEGLIVRTPASQG